MKAHGRKKGKFNNYYPPILQSDIRTGWIKSDNKGDNQNCRHQNMSKKESQLQNNKLTNDILRPNQYSPLEIE